ncbi:hypothetical protein PsorP6_014321 [Peronosclerospora sorghi]|uniref:Uncharacterized protein n=1 Tax=Peronosclerospora sorghi TaxID=230839 RepID=A0ACC0VGL1_9STRA|nr:hypothetical protein PsorP6_014321 [Peronosclerospora sorghi]
MESHFERVLTTDVAPKRSEACPSASRSPKRVRLSSSLPASKISDIVDGAKAQEDDALDARALKSMANSLTKQVQRNALAREKYAHEPTKFLDSELALNTELVRWKQVAAKPELFSAMTELHVPRTLLGLFGHENMDVRLAVLSLLAELTDVDAAVESLEPARKLAQHLVEEKLLPLLVTNMFELARAADHMMEGSSDEEEMGMYHSLQILENLADLEPNVCVEVVTTTEVLQFLLQQAAPERKFSENKLYASEILSILVQSGAKPRENFVVWSEEEQPQQKPEHPFEKSVTNVDLLDALLQALAPYRKKDPSGEEEAEFVSNLVNSLCCVLLVPKAQTHFRHLEGLELLLRFLKDRQRFIFGGALRCLDHALVGNGRNCERLIEVGGLRSVFSVFMGRHGKYKSPTSHTKANKAQERAKQVEHVVNILASLCAWISERAPADGYARLYAKFLENEKEKIDRCMDLFVEYYKRVEDSNEEDRGEEDADIRYLRRLDAGLFVLERIAFVLAHLCRFSTKLRAYVMIKFHEHSIDSESLVAILREQLEFLLAEEKEAIEGKEGTDDVVSDDAKRAQKVQLQLLLETLDSEDAREEEGEVKTAETLSDETTRHGTTCDR